jgi:uncharacterized protein
MQLHVLRELRQPLGSVDQFDIDEATLTLDDLTFTDLSGTLSLLRTDEGLLVRVHATASTVEPCSRCLVETACSVEIDFEEEYVAQVDAHIGARVRLSPSEERFIIGPDFLLDLKEGLRQYILMSEPQKPLCRSDCAGICATCGADLNNETCACPPATDERWSALAGLAGSDSEGS